MAEVNMEERIRPIFLELKKRNGKEFRFLELIRSARATTVLKISNQKNYALKFIDLNDKEIHGNFDLKYRIDSLENEIMVLQGIKDHFDMYVDSGQNNSLFWLLTNWKHGLPVSNYMSKIKAEKNDSLRKTQTLKLFITILERICELHVLGYLHRDIQPAHIFVTEQNNIDLLDFGLSKNIQTGKGISFHGALVHFNPPEIADKVLQEVRDIPYDILSEVYSIGSVLYFLYTGHTSTNYGTTDYKKIPFKEKLRLISYKGARLFSETDAIPFPQLERIVMWCLEKNRQSRCPNLHEAIKAMKKIDISSQEIPAKPIT